MKKFLPFLLLCLMIFGGSLHYFYSYNIYNQPSQEARTITLIPLDSRPCNTQYPQLLAEMVQYSLLTPENSLLDNFLQPSNTAQLWTWLDDAVTQSEQVIIFTNQLFNGGLINSRNSNSYEQIPEQLTQLENFLRKYPDKAITVVTILPRLKPSQFDETLWPYEVALSAWGQTLDQAAANNEPLPPIPAEIPRAIAEQYRNLYECSRQLTLTLADFAKQGLLDRYIIGQDDGEQWCPSNDIIRQLQQIASDNVTIIHGADELTMLLIANMTADNQPTAVNLRYTAPERLKDYYPYEAADLETIINEKLSLANLTLDSEAPYTIIIHNDSEQNALAKRWLQNTDDYYLALADIAYTNKGDPALSSELMDKNSLDRISCAAGWNTAGNSLGTIFAQCRIMDTLSHQYFYLNKQQKKTALAALYQFKFIRLAEDYIYQAILSNPLRSDLENWLLMDYTTAFLPNSQSEAQQILIDRFSPYQTILKESFEGEHQIRLGHQTINFTISQFDGIVVFPWARAFEIQALCTFELTLNH